MHILLGKNVDGWPMSEIKNEICLQCGRDMTPVYDRIAKKVTGYLWECECTPGIFISIG